MSLILLEELLNDEPEDRPGILPGPPSEVFPPDSRVIRYGNVFRVD
jgi:hypothetical protein